VKISLQSRCNLKLFGHVTRRERLAKIVLLGTIRGGRKRGRQKKRWEDNSTEWTGSKLSKAVKHTEDREGRRGLVRRLSVAPQQQPPRTDEKRAIRTTKLTGQNVIKKSQTKTFH
jgi:hypothetical protein